MVKIMRSESEGPEKTAINELFNEFLVNVCKYYFNSVWLFIFLLETVNCIACAIEKDNDFIRNNCTFHVESLYIILGDACII
jgi:hypothetical protein